ncbi:MAG TPA: DUF177 domain-containing protein [Alphaproteobacteria bacterium]
MRTEPLELSRIVQLPTLKEKRFFSTHVTATEDEKKALAQRYEILAVNDLQADVKIKSLGEGMYRVSTAYKAEIVQACGVTLQPVVQHIDDQDEELLTTSSEHLIPFDEAEAVGDVPTELIINDEIDYGEIIAQLIALSIDPFPRAEGQNDSNMFAHVEHNNSPFAELAALQANTNKKKND